MHAYTKMLIQVLLPAAWLLLTAADGLSQVAVIAHKSVREDTLSKTELIDFYTGDIKRWGNGQRVVVLDLKQKGEVKEAFYDYLGKSSSRMKSIWLKKMLSGEGDPPMALNSEDEVVKKIASTPGAIGFVDLSKVNNDVKTLLIIPKKSSS